MSRVFFVRENKKLHKEKPPPLRMIETSAPWALDGNVSPTKDLQGKQCYVQNVYLSDTKFPKCLSFLEY